MSEVLRSVGLDVGTTSTQMIVSELEIENRAGSFAVPEMEIQDRKILYKSPVHFTPLLDENRVDADRLRQIVDEEYARAGITKAQVDTGAVIITGETSRKENARAVLDALAGYAGEFVVATAGPDLESVLAAKGAGATAYSEQFGKRVLHMDIGGGTSNLSLIEDGKIMSTGCFNIGGRLLKLDGSGKLTYVSPVLDGLFSKKVGDYVNHNDAQTLSQTLTHALEMAAGLAEPTPLLDAFATREANHWHIPAGEPPVISFSGGVADCIRHDPGWLAYGDIGPELGQAIAASRLCQGEYIIGEEPIRATVIGAGCHSAQLSGSTVFHQNIDFPLKNIPVVHRPEQLSQLDGPGALALDVTTPGSYQAIQKLAANLAASFGTQPVLAVMEADMAKALGQALALLLGRDAKILCFDRVQLEDGSFLDVGTPVGPALPVVVKTLVLSH